METPSAANDLLVTVIAVCYNHARFAVECLESVRQQEWPRVELIIVDDCSRDDSVQVIEHWVEENHVDCILLAHKQNIGLCRTLNEALDYAHGKYVCIVATDDVWMPEKLARQARLFESLPDDFAVVYSDAIQISETGAILPERFMAAHGSTKVPPHGNVLIRLVEGNFVPAPSAMIRRSAIDAAGRYDERLCYEDWDMWLRLASRHRFAYSDYVSAKHRVVATSMTRTVLASTNRAFVVSSFLIAEKLLALDSLPASTRRSKQREISRLAWKLCALGDSESLPYLGAALKLEWRPLTAVLIVLGSFPLTSRVAVRVARSILRGQAIIEWQLSKLK